VVELAGLEPATAQLSLLLRRVLLDTDEGGAYFPARRAVGAEPLGRSSRLTE
jgi:hypothetical protein